MTTESLLSLFTAKVAGVFGGEEFFGADFDTRLAADRRLSDAGLLGYHWPREYGGQAGTVADSAALDMVLADIGLSASLSPSRFGINLLGPALIAHGTDEQKGHFLPRILAVEDIWCQGFSEPEAGSDLAAVATTARRRDDDQFVVTGSKTWTTQAHRADLCFALVRTGDRDLHHRGLIMVLIPLRSPGVTITPIRQNTGQAELNTVFFDGVVVPPTHVLGEPGDGWAVARTMLAHERSYGQGARYGQYMAELAAAAGEVDAVDDNEARTMELHLSLADSADRLLAVSAMATLVSNIADSGGDLGTLPSAVKLWWSTTHQALMDTRLRAALAGMVDVPAIGEKWLASRAETIYAGASEIQLGIIAERRLGLPRD